jgi:uncharacterized membrane protein
MLLLIAGLVIVLSVHSVHIVAGDWRIRMQRRFGKGIWHGVYSVLSMAGFLIVIWGYGLTRTNPWFLWHPPVFTRHVAAVLTLVAFIIFASSIVRGNRIKQVVGQPMVLGVMIWAWAHIMANGRLGDVVLFGSFLLWAIVDFAWVRRTQQANAGRTELSVKLGRDLATVVIGVLAWAVFILWLHQWLIGVRPFG